MNNLQLPAQTPATQIPRTATEIKNVRQTTGGLTHISAQ
ncbi:hypothetical protein JOF39_003070 [Glutamicibacter protophormiae]|uniref:Uncharacterized protein n=1 Tax=Glutamicibacter protophormiae TaxID=37930 RepID=A0ABS4XTZ9_GLUPR|nr:hypothetical protein [Glutamicibacter protophormiae]